MKFLHIPWEWTIPNALSLVRIALIPAFMVLYLTHNDGWAFAMLALSGVTDVLDGFIARHYNQITDCGKLLDPLSDKLAQIAVVIALTTRHIRLLPLAILCSIKEAFQAVGGIILLTRRTEVQGAEWFGKLSTAVFYAGMLTLVLFPHLPTAAEWAIVGTAGACMLLAFGGYLRMFIHIRRASEAGTPELSERG